MVYWKSVGVRRQIFGLFAKLPITNKITYRLMTAIVDQYWWRSLRQVLACYRITVIVHEQTLFSSNEYILLNFYLAGDIIQSDIWYPFHNPYQPPPPGQMTAIAQTTFSNAIFTNEIFCILIRISFKYVLKGSIESKPVLVQVMNWRVTGDKPLSEAITTQFIDACMRL